MSTSSKDADPKDVELRVLKVEEQADAPADAPVYITGFKLVLVMIALMISFLLINLDQTIIATALPRIVSVFNALDLVTWVAAAYFLTQAGLMLVVGQLISIIPIKPVFLLSIILFEIGSVLCGAAPSMEVLIFGRAVAGCGAAGIAICVLGTISTLTRLEDRPILLAVFGAVLGMASILGPILGGAFTDHVSWRWCFYINLPFGAISFVAMVLWLPNRTPPGVVKTGSTFSILKRNLDWVGSLLCLGLSTCIVLGLTWGGAVKPWKSFDVLFPLSLAGVLIIAFVFWEMRQGDQALVPLSLFTRRTHTGACLEGLWLLTAMIVTTYYLPLWYQINGKTSIQSGVAILPTMLSYVIAACVSSGIASATGHYWIFLAVSPLLSVAGSALLYKGSAFTSSARLLGYQILVGAGLGSSFQLTFISLQAEWAEDPDKITQASAILTFMSTFGGLVGISIAGTLYNNRLATNLAKIPDIAPDTLKALTESITVIATLPEPLRSEARVASVDSLLPVFLIPLVVSVLGSLCSGMIKSYNLKERSALIARKDNEEE
ncbi:hypothetical protein QCA50_004979 [Cerrena zonata]|uniref:Major facilitator superfamily (MFS) profile domain-containing protein n=1 Tax=Cerrena zonata TaxID=2478898 RepID=A0AAW0GKF1_9APHY